MIASSSFHILIICILLSSQTILKTGECSSAAYVKLSNPNTLSCGTNCFEKYDLPIIGNVSIGANGLLEFGNSSVDPVSNTFVSTYVILSPFNAELTGVVQFELQNSSTIDGQLASLFGVSFTADHQFVVDWNTTNSIDLTNDYFQLVLTYNSQFVFACYFYDQLIGNSSSNGYATAALFSNSGKSLILPYSGTVNVTMLYTTKGNYADSNGNTKGNFCFQISPNFPECTVDSQCSDGLNCTSDSCTASTFQCKNTDTCPNSEVNCTSSFCTINGCNSTAYKCNDGINCTDDQCVVGTGCQYVANNTKCESVYACVSGICNATTGCEYTANNSSCNDHDNCTTDICHIDSGCSNVIESICLISFTISNVNMDEGATGANTSFVFEVSMSQNSSFQITTYVSTQPGTAISGVDYQPVNDEKLVFTPYTSKLNVTVIVYGDSLFEGNNTFYLMIVNATSNQSLLEFNTNSEGVGTILNDDVPELSNHVYFVGQKVKLVVNEANGLFSDSNVEIANNPYAVALLETLPTYGSISLQSDGSFTYNTSICYVDDRFIYYVKDSYGNVYDANVLIMINVCSTTSPTLVLFYYPTVFAWIETPKEAANQTGFYFKFTDPNGNEFTSPSWEAVKPRGPLPAQNIYWSPSSLLSSVTYNITAVSEPNSYTWDVYPSSIVANPYFGKYRYLCTCS